MRAYCDWQARSHEARRGKRIVPIIGVIRQRFALRAVWARLWFWRDTYLRAKASAADG